MEIFQTNHCQVKNSIESECRLPLSTPEIIHKNEDPSDITEGQKVLDLDITVDLHDICRGCLSIATVQNMQDISIGGVEIKTIYENISKLKIECDNLPAMICLNCIEEFTKINNFIKMLKHSSTILINAVEEIKTLNDNVNKDLYKIQKANILKKALSVNFIENIKTIDEEDKNESRDILNNDMLSIPNDDSSSGDDLPLSHKFKLSVSTNSNTDNEMEVKTACLRKKKSRKRKGDTPNNNKIIDKHENKTQINLANWNESKCVKQEFIDNPSDYIVQVENLKMERYNEKDDNFNDEDEDDDDDGDQDIEFDETERDEFEEDENYVAKSFKKSSKKKSIILIFDSNVKERNKKYTCNKCENVSFTNYKHVESHLKTDHVEETTCILCEEEFTNWFSLLYHMMIKHGKLKCCRLCLVSFKNSGELHAHYKSEEHNTKCTVCKEEFKNRKALYEHRRKKHLNPQLENQKYKCPECPKEFANQNNIRRHIMVAHNDQRFLCDTCGQSYTTKRNLKLHIQKFHEGIEVQNKTAKKNFFCEACGRELKIFHKYAIALHIAKHKGHNFVCKRCYDSFQSEELFKKHVEESGHDLFKCDKCTSQFVREENFKIHLKNHEAPGWNKNMFATWGKSAKLRNEKGEFVCSYCPKVFKDKQRLDNHVRVHTNERPYKCHICSKGFKTWIHRKTHLNIHLGIKKWICKYCGKAFTNSCTLKGHEMLHTGERPHHCPECKKGFITMSAMKKHRMVHFRNSNCLKKEKVNAKEEKSGSDHEENAEFLYKYGQIFTGPDVSYDESFTNPPKESIVNLVELDKELSC